MNLRTQAETEVNRCKDINLLKDLVIKYLNRSQHNLERASYWETLYVQATSKENDWK